MKCKRLLVVMLCITALLPIGSAQAYLVHDPTTMFQIMKALKVAQEQLEQLRAVQSKMEAVKGQLSGKHNFSSMIRGRINSSIPDSWESLVSGACGGNAARCLELKAMYEKNHRTLDDNDYRKHSSASSAQVYKRKKQVTKAVSVATTLAYDNLKKHEQRIQQLQNQLDAVDTAKASLDLGNAIQLESVAISLDTQRVMLMLTKLSAQRSSESLNTQTQSNLFTRLKEGTHEEN